MKLLGERVIFREDKPKEKKSVILTKEEVSPFINGIVVAVGDEINLSLKEDGKLFVKRSDAEKVVWDGEELLMVEGDNIIAI